MKTILVSDSKQSLVYEFTYNLVPVVSTDKSGTYNTIQDVTLTASLPNSTIYYTIDNSTPTTSNTVYSTPISIYKSTTIRAFAVTDETKGAIHEFSLTLPTPTINTNVEPGRQYDEFFVQLTASPSWYDNIYYTIDGRDPIQYGTQYTAPIPVTQTTTIKAVATYNNDFSTVYSFDYSIMTGSDCTPSQTYHEEIFYVTLTPRIPGSIIYYTTDGTSPNKNSPVYSDPIEIYKPTTLTYTTTKEGCESDSRVIRFGLPAPVVSADYPSGILPFGESVTLTTSIKGYDIFYTLDGSDPKTNGILYTAPLEITQNTTLRAITKKYDAESAELTKEYTVFSALPSFPLHVKYDAAKISSSENGLIYFMRTNGTVEGQPDWRMIVDIAAGGNHIVGLRHDGRMESAGDNSDSQCEVNSWTNIAGITAGAYHTVGLKDDGRVLCTTPSVSNNYGQADTQSWENIVAVSAGSYHTVGLRQNGTVVAIGDNSYGQCNVSEWSDIVKISAGATFTVGLKSDGTVVAVGNNLRGQCNVFDWKFTHRQHVQLQS